MSGGLPRNTVHCVGGGPTGALLAIFLRRRGFPVTLYEARTDPRAGAAESGRSINLALADRGIHALKLAGVYEAVADQLLPMRGRQVHAQDGSEVLHPYGQRADEVIYSVSRHRLNRALLEVAIGGHGVDVQFQHRLTAADFAAGIAEIRDVRSGHDRQIAMHPLLATDGAGSIARRCMSGAGLIAVEEADLAHGYKELSIPAAADGTHRMAPDALHVWPRGNFMLIALPNVDGSFTATLFLPNRGAVSFESLTSGSQVENFFAAQFPDAFALMPDCCAEFREHPTGFLGTVYADRWSVGDRAALVGDSAHAIVPFHGQGMNCCFEDCVAFDGCIGRNGDWQSVFADYFAVRKPNTDAIAAMALDNYLEMRERVADPAFRLQQSLALELERRRPERFIPRYSMVMFHHEIPYHVAQARGSVQARLLAELTEGAASLADVDYARAEREIDRRLAPITDFREEFSGPCGPA